MSSDAVLLDRDDSVATITLNRPDKRNALSREILVGFRDVLDEIEDSGARCLVIKGAGDVFSAGGDISQMEATLEDEGSPEEEARDVERQTLMMAELRRFPVFTIAKIDGPAVGAGAALAIACDIQVASERLKMGFVFRNVGLTVDNAVSYVLPRIVGENVAKELALTGKTVDADEAAELGLVNHVYPTDEFDVRAAELIEQIAAGPTVALEHGVELLENGMNASIEQAIKDESKAQAIVGQTADHREGVKAFFDDREPEFEGR
jgi:2-(1,2-epoxy-1,2-dihydrophenyl)acetyl-CoA isomerase